MNYFKTKAGTELPILQLKGKDYLQVAHRLVWFREEHPTWTIETEFLKLEDKFAIAKATIKNDAGQIMATGHKREDASHFADFMEKAETGSLGRCLAYIGYGTQFCADELDEGERLADAPVPVTKQIKSVSGSLPLPVKSTQSVEAPPPVSSADWEGFPSGPAFAPESRQNDSSTHPCMTYRVPFGKTYKGMSFDEMTMDKVTSFSTYLQESAVKDGKPMNKQAQEFCDMADEWIRTVRNRG
jgi:hypothetical protein